MASLRKLSLCSSFYWGFYPKLSLEGIYFPSLQSLALGNFTFFQDEQLNWIISHGSTLKELYLDDCPILSHVRILDYQENSGKCPLPASEMQLAREEDRGDSWLYDYPRQWSEYFASFEGGLGCLRHFAIGSSEKWNFTHGLPFGMEKDLQPVLLESRYSSFDGGQIRRNIGEKNWLKRYGEDREALKSLYRKITQQ